MRRIIKGAEPEAVRNWKEENAAVSQNLTFSNMPKEAAKLQMLQEQGYLCAYTMQRIETLSDCHIEHLESQNQSPHRILDYNNMLACFPGNNPPPEWIPKYPYGAQQKGGRHINENNFVSPLRNDVEMRFLYKASGLIEPAFN